MKLGACGEFARCSVPGPMVGDTPSRVVVLRMCRRVSTAFGWLTHTPGKPHLYRAMTVIITSVLGRAREPQSGFPDGVGVGWVGGAAVGPQGLLPGRVLKRFEEQIIDEDGVVLAVVDVPVICSDKFLQSSSLAWRRPSFSSSTEWQRRHFREDSTGAVLGEGG